MQSRRSLLSRLAAGAGALFVPRFLFARPHNPIEPFGVGDVLPLGWSIHALGAETMTLGHTDGRTANVRISARIGVPIGLAHTERLDLVLLNGGEGRAHTDEDLARVLMGMAAAIGRQHGS